MKMERRTALAAIAAAALAGAAWGGPAAAQQKVLKVVPHADLKNTDPIWTTAYITRNHGYMVYDTLFAMDANLKPQPQMVDTWKVSDDKLTWTFALRDGLKWHDGAPVTSEDCIASLKRWGARDGMGQKFIEAVAEMKALDARSFEIKMKFPYGLVLESIGKISSNVPFMMPKRHAETDPFKQVPEVIGSGPFKFVKEEWVPGSKVVYVKNADYVPRKEPPSAASGGKVVKIDRVEWLYIPDAQTAMNALINGEIDYYEQPPVDFIPIMSKAAGVKVEMLDPLGSQGMLRMNHLHPPFDNPKARQAMLWLMKQEDYLAAGVGNPEYYRTCYSYFACGTPLETDVGTEPIQEKDVERAKRLFQEAGYDGRPVVILQPTDNPIGNAVAQVTASVLREAGVDAQLQAMDWATVTSRRAVKEPPEQGGWNIFPTWWIGGDIASPITHAGLSAACDKAWFGWPCDEEMERLRDAFATELDPEKRKQIAEDIQERAFEIVTHGNFGQWFTPTGYRDTLSGLIRAPVPFFWNIEVQG